jgi:glucose-1-phosphate cytidylyltransferase
MKAIILAAEETNVRPKPMIEIGGRPILWHIMKIYSAHGVNDFVICCGYKGYTIKEYFANYFLHMSDVTFDMKENRMRVHQGRAEPWTVTLVDTGDDTMTGGRVLRVADYVRKDEFFLLTYRRLHRFPSGARQEGDPDHHLSSGPFWCRGDEGRRPGQCVRGEAAGRWRYD